MTDAGRGGRMPELGARVEAITRGWKGPLRKAVVSYALAKSGSNLEKGEHDRLSKLLEDALNREAGGPAVPPEATRAQQSLGGKTPMSLVQNVLPEVSKILAAQDEKFAIRALRIFFTIPRAVKKHVPLFSGTRIAADHERAFNALKALMAQIPPDSLPTRRVWYGDQSLIKKYPRGVYHKTLDRVRLPAAPVDVAAAIGVFFAALPPGSRTPERDDDFDNQLATYDSGPRMKGLIKELTKKTTALTAGKPEPETEQEEVPTQRPPEPLRPAPEPLRPVPEPMQPRLPPERGLPPPEAAPGTGLSPEQEAEMQRLIDELGGGENNR